MEYSPRQVRRLDHDPIMWPGGARIALTLTFDYEAEEHFKYLAPGMPDFHDVTERAFGGRVGIWRVLKTLERHKRHATFYICGAVLANYPDSCRALLDRGHDIAGHTYHHEYLHLLTAEAEHAVFQRQNGAFEDFYGEPLAGFRTCFSSDRTPDILADYGYLWDSSRRDDDLPFFVERDDGRVYLEIPRGINGDAVLLGTPTPNIFNSHKIGLSDGVLAHWKAEFDACYRWGGQEPRMMTLTMHPYNIGRPSRIRVLDEFLDYVGEHVDVWVATQRNIADWYIEQTEPGKRLLDSIGRVGAT